MSKRIILDTNALMAINEFKLDVFSAIERGMNEPYELVVLDGVLDELHKIMVEQKGKYKLSAKLALSILDAKRIKIVESEGNVDDFLVTLSEKGQLVLTQDVELKKRLKKPYLTIRQKKKVILVE
ncbi:DNA-binding protein [Candidatus Woesearchaeota archaeon]|jgi:rRNA-processing protein FCF1|nr:DNA-binding protein [Candidatus Woesearchaeota archaeon]MBT4150608.1 DNA-binding protein [Candidatus Woesearchaeota archaeon]MBT4247826.1 DNA-binding protein [Candidatus Woesearchaeota archaeon]MBT4434250.1 DNA-binding protein [Candidatus Woesearchaeota archaeon]MBT7331829.1 DNA-binding protein [Candidatus Woesearchaeota archaeon]